MAKSALDTFLTRYGKAMKKTSAQPNNAGNKDNADKNAATTSEAKQSPMPASTQMRKKRNRFKVKPKPEQVYKGENPEKIAKKSSKAISRRKNTPANKKSDRPATPPLQKKASSAVKIALFTFLKNKDKEANDIYMQALHNIPVQKIELAYQELADEFNLTDEQQKAYKQMLFRVKKYQNEKRKELHESANNPKIKSKTTENKNIDTNTAEDKKTKKEKKKMADTTEFKLSDEQEKFLKDNHIDEQPKSAEEFDKLKEKFEHDLRAALTHQVHLEYSEKNPDKATDDDIKAQIEELKKQKDKDEELIAKSDKKLVTQILQDFAKDEKDDEKLAAIEAIRKRHNELNVSEENSDKPTPIVNNPNKDEESEASWVKEKDEFYKAYAASHSDFKYERDENVKDELVATMNGAKVHYVSKDNVSVSKEAKIIVFEAMLQDPHNQGRVVNFAENMSPEVQARLYAACLLHGNELGTGAPETISEAMLNKLKEELGEERYKEFLEKHNARQPQPQPKTQRHDAQISDFDKNEVSKILDEQVEMAKLAKAKQDTGTLKQEDEERLKVLSEKDIDSKAFLAAQYTQNPNEFKNLLGEKLKVDTTKDISTNAAIRETQISTIRTTKDRQELQNKEAARQDTRALMAYKMGIINKEKAQELGIIDKDNKLTKDINTGNKDAKLIAGTEIKEPTDAEKAKVDKTSVNYQAMQRRFGEKTK